MVEYSLITINKYEYSQIILVRWHNMVTMKGTLKNAYSFNNNVSASKIKALLLDPSSLLQV